MADSFEPVPVSGTGPSDQRDVFSTGDLLDVVVERAVGRAPHGAIDNGVSRSTITIGIPERAQRTTVCMESASSSGQAWH